MAVPSAEEERKRAVLRALKDLEYERSVGKVSDADYAELSNQYRTEAKALLRALEEQDKPARERAERLLDKRLRKAGLDKPAEDERKPSEIAEEGAQLEDAEHDDDPVSQAVAEDESELSDGDGEPDSDAEPTAKNSKKSAVLPSRACTECDTRNDLDAAFCKKCGDAMAEDDQRLCGACPAVFGDEEESCPKCGVPYND